MNNCQRTIGWGLCLLLMALLPGCGAQHRPESDRFLRSVCSELPFSLDSVDYMGSRSATTLRFTHGSRVTAQPDMIINSDGDTHVGRLLMKEPVPAQTEGQVWRNVVVSDRNRRVICIDRYLRKGKTDGYIYVFQSQTKRFPTYGTYQWDVSDAHNIEMMGAILADLDALAVKRLTVETTEAYAAPASQDDYWALIFHADSLMDDRRYEEAAAIYDLAFSDDRYILPSQLTATAMKMQTVGDRTKALAYLRHRMDMEHDYYMDPEACLFPELKDSFGLRSRQWRYNLELKERLEWVFERDQYDRQLWQQAAHSHPADARRTERLARRAMQTDSVNLLVVSDVLATVGFPGRQQVGDMASQAVWLVFQHADLDRQRRFLPQLQQAVNRGDIAPFCLALLRDRIDIREGRPQRYGTQTDAQGHLCPLLDASKVNQWRAEVGLPPITVP